MKKVVSLIFALMLMLFAAVSVSADVSPDPPIPDDEIIIDAIPVPGEAGSTTPDINNPGRVEVNSGEEVTLTATPSKGYKFSHWEFSYGEFEIVSGDLTTPVIVIRPTGSGGSKIRAEAHFVKIDEPLPPVSSETVPTLPTDPTSPITGIGSTNVVSGVIIATSLMIASIVAVVVLKKKFDN